MTKVLASVFLAIGLLTASDAALAAQQTVALAVENMYCEACPYMVKKTLQLSAPPVPDRDPTS